MVLGAFRRTDAVSRLLAVAVMSRLRCSGLDALETKRSDPYMSQRDR
jgi:hypothetical protein